jgi:hypothetical protein
MLKNFKPQKIDSPKIRLGIERDGGYVMSEIVLNNCTALLTYGVGGECSYEEEFIRKYNKPVYMFDHTIGQASWDREDGLHFISEGLGNGENCKDVKEHYDQFNISGDIFLKIDTEGAAYDYFLNTDIDSLSSFVGGLLFEIHWLEDINNQDKCIKIFEKLNKHFVLTHVHGNNWGGEFEYNEFKIPKVAEFSLVNKKYITEFTPDNQDYPIPGLDFKNNPNGEDCDLTFLKQF